MHGDEHPTKTALQRARQRTIDRLSEAFARDELGLEEFEQRLDRAYRSSSAEALEKLTEDLSRAVLSSAGHQGTGFALARAPNDALAPSRVTAPVRLFAVLSSVERNGRFRLSDGTRLNAVFGNIELDVRDVVFPPGVTEVHVRALFGNIEITVPPDLAVECTGSAFLGNFETTSRVPPAPEPEAPMLRVIGSVLLGNVEVHTRLRKR